MTWFVELPQPTIAAIAGIVLALMGLLVKWVSAYVPWLGEFLKQFEGSWGAALTTAIVVWLQNVLPGGDLSNISVLAVQLIVALVVYGLGKVGLARAKVAGFK